MKKWWNQEEYRDYISDDRVEYLEHASNRQRFRRRRNMLVAVAVLTVVVMLVFGIFASLLTGAKDMVDTLRIAFLPSQNYPQQTGLENIYQAEAFAGGFIELGQEGCVVYSAAGSRLNSVQTGYARPAVAVGKNRFALYNRSGNELRVFSRVQELYTRKMENNIFLCAVSGSGKVAVVTEDVRHVALVSIFSETMDQLLSWGMSADKGTPLRMAFAVDNKRLALAAVAVEEGLIKTNLYLLDVRRDEENCIASLPGCTPVLLQWVGLNTLLVVFDDHASIYNVWGTEQARYDFPDATLLGASENNGTLALLFAAGQGSLVLTLDKNLAPQFNGYLGSAHSVERSGNYFYLLGENTVQCYTQEGEYQWMREYLTRPQKLVQGRQLLLFAGNTVELLTPPEESEN